MGVGVLSKAYEDLEFFHDVVEVWTIEDVVAESSVMKVQNPTPLPKTLEKQNVQGIQPQVVGSLGHLQEVVST
jgi:hypothetical protein